MPEKSIEQKKSSGSMWPVTAVILLLVPLTLLASRYFGGRRYYLCSVLLILYAMIPFFAGFEKRRPQAREVVTIAVLCAIAVASRAAFIMLPSFKPMLGIIIIAAIAFGPQAGFLIGAVSAFVSNFIFGQGPWTPWQMFAFGIAGFLGGLLAQKGFLRGDRPVRAAVFGGIVAAVVVGPLLDLCTILTMSSMVDTTVISAVFLSGLPLNLVHALATVLTLWLLCRPMTEKLDRIKLKYGMMEK